MNPPTTIPETRLRRPRTLLPRSREEMQKRWLAVLISGVTLFVAITTLLQIDASGRSAIFTRKAQQAAIVSTSERTRGQQQAVFDNYLAARAYDELWAASTRFAANGLPDLASVYITASQQITALSPLMQPPYTSKLPGSSQWSGALARYESDTWVVTSTLQSQQREAMGREANAWDSKANNYVASIAIFAVSLFLFGLAATLSGVVRWMFVAVGLGLTGITALGVLLTVLLSVHHVPDAALEAYARGFGLVWQRQYTEAIQQFDRAIRLDGGYAAAYSERGKANMNLNPPKLDVAIKDLQSALDKGDTGYDVYWDLGWGAYLVGDVRSAIQNSQKAFDANPRVCGPDFNIAIAHLSGGALAQAETSYGAAIAHCEKILKESLAAGTGAPSSMWGDIQGSISDIDNLLCQTHKLHCYVDRDKPSIKNVRDLLATRALAEKMRRRVQEALTAMEFQHTASVHPTGAAMAALLFGNIVSDAEGSNNYNVVRDVFPNDGQDIYALWTYTGMKHSIFTVFKVFYDGDELIGQRYAYEWDLDENSTAQKKIGTLRRALQPGLYRVEIYGDGELLTEGTFTLSSANPLTAPATATINPVARVAVGNVLLADDFADNTHGWWSGAIDRTRESKPADGELSVRTTGKDNFWRAACQDCGSFDNFYYEVGTRFAAGPEDQAYGIVARADLAMRNFYLFLIAANGQYTIDKAVNGKLTALMSWTPLSAINVKGSNRLGISARGSSLEFFINGQSVRRITDSTIAAGYVGVSVEHDGLDVGYSRLRVWQLR